MQQRVRLQSSTLRTVSSLLRIHAAPYSSTCNVEVCSTGRSNTTNLILVKTNARVRVVVRMHIACRPCKVQWPGCMVVHKSMHNDNENAIHCGMQLTVLQLPRQNYQWASHRLVAIITCRVVKDGMLWGIVCARDWHPQWCCLISTPIANLLMLLLGACMHLLVALKFMQNRKHSCLSSVCQCLGCGTCYAPVKV